jgi:hypothetical protein
MEVMSLSRPKTSCLSEQEEGKKKAYFNQGRMPESIGDRQKTDRLMGYVTYSRMYLGI